MKPFLFILVSFILLCCGLNQNDYSHRASTEASKDLCENSTAQPPRVYDSLKIDIAAQKAAYLSQLKAGKGGVLKNAGVYLDSMICEQLFPHWKGTPWDFNGHTDKPNSGNIACGYLVSTLLKHAGLNINRYKLAQQSSFNEIKTLGFPEEPQHLGTDWEVALEKIKKMPDGLYVLGLSYHVGFIRVKANEVLFLHSTYLEPTAVVKEKAKESEAFMYSDVYYIGKVTGNETLMKKWINSSPISIFMD